jgi:phosphoglycolate phosphatase
MQALSRGDRDVLEELMRVSQYVEEERRFLATSPLVAGSSVQYGPLWAAVLAREASPALYAEIDGLFGHFGLERLVPVGDPAAVAAELAARGFRLGLATNDAERAARDQARALGIAGRLAFVAGYDSGFGAKPDPGMVLAFAQSIGCRPGETALVGDSLHDLHAARAAGAVAIAVLSGPLGQAARAELAPHADLVIDTLSDLPGALDAVEPAA